MFMRSVLRRLKSWMIRLFSSFIPWLKRHDSQVLLYLCAVLLSFHVSLSVLVRNLGLVS